MDSSGLMKKITVKNILNKKGRDKISMLTCYDYSFAKILDEAGVDMILVGDSLANVILGLEETRQVSLTEMFNHTQAVAKPVKRSLVVADMPYAAYQKDPDKCVKAGRRFMELGADAVKVEWFKDCAYVVKKLIKNKIPVMGHIGLTPQTAHLLDGYKVQGKDNESANRLIEQAKLLQDLGVFSIVLECMPYQVARLITDSLKIPTIGIGAGKYCDGQVLVLYDLLGIYKDRRPKFVRAYRDFYSETKDSITKFIKDIKKNKFPNRRESFSLEKGVK